MSNDDDRGAKPYDAEFRVAENGVISFDLHGLLHGLHAEMRLEIAESLACDETVLKGVVDLLISGRTEHFLYDTWTTGSKPYYEEQRTRLLEHVEDVRLKVVQEIMHIRDHQEKALRAWRSHAEALRRLLYEKAERGFVPPKSPDYQHGKHYTREEAQAIIEDMAP